MSDNKLIEYKNLIKAIGRLKNKKIVLVGGCFDIFHFGHLTFLKKSKRLGDILIVALEPDEFIIKRKHRQPVHTQDQRAQILSSLEVVNYVVKLPFFVSDNQYYDMVNIIKPAIIAITEGDKQMINKSQQAKMVAGKLVVACKFIKNFSTSQIINGKIIFGN